MVLPNTTPSGASTVLQWSKTTLLVAMFSRQAMQQPVQADGLERLRGQPERLQRVCLMRFGLVTVKALGRDFERCRVEIHQRDVRRLRRKAALVEQVAGANADVEMACRDVLVVESNQTPRRASPRKMTVEAQNNRVVDP
jgi:hypothetical protein